MKLNQLFRVMPDGSHKYTVIIDPTDQLLIVNKNAFYKLGYPVEDIIEGSMLIDSVPVTWCSASQKWVE